MAVIKIKNIKSNLQAVINYGKNGDKTKNGILVSSVNCSVETAYEEIKNDFCKEIESKQKTQEFIIAKKHTKMKNRC